MCQNDVSLEEGSQLRCAETMREVAILADDLTGALDTAAVFATPDMPVVVSWQPINARRIAIDTATRDVDITLAQNVIKENVHILVDSKISFKKIDSLLRGNTFVEIATCAQSDQFDTICIAPAFPDQGRTTIGGAAHKHGKKFVNIVEQLKQSGVEATRLPVGVHPSSKGIFVCDASSANHLHELAAIHESYKILWCGSSGLARALATKPLRPTIPKIRLAIFGSRHNQNLVYKSLLRNKLGAAVVSVFDRTQLKPAIDLLREGQKVALVFESPDMSPEAAAMRYVETFSTLVSEISVPEGIIVVGGDTIFRLARAAGVISLEALGEYAPGLPISRFRGGIWNECMVISKSGSFADYGLFDAFSNKEI